MKKKYVYIIIGVIVAILLVVGTIFIVSKNKNGLEKLPLPEIEEGARGELGIDKNINEKTIDKYLNRSDSVYRDMRMLVDPGDYESIGGDSDLSGYIKGFTVIPLPYIIKVNGLPESVGDTYQGRTLFSVNSEGKYVANYEESMSFIEEYFPKDKYIFLMCGGGGYAGMMKNFLVSLGWDSKKIYNIGGFWYYEGENKVDVKKVNGEYDFSNVPYIKIDFANMKRNEKVVNTVDVDVEKVSITPATLSLVIGEKYQLTPVIYPTNANEKRVTWTSSDESILTVDDKGNVVALKEGTVEVTITSLDGNFTATSKITITKEPVKNYVKLDDISKEVAEYNKVDTAKLVSDLWDEFWNIVDENEEKYNDSEGNFNDEYRKFMKEYEGKEKEILTPKIDIINNLLDSQKSFIVLLTDPGCGAGGFTPVYSAEKILKNNKIPYFLIEFDENKIFEYSKLYFKKAPTAMIMIIKEGKLYKYTSNLDTFKKDADVKKWLKKYIEIK